MEISKWIDEHLFTKNRKSINNRALIDSWWVKNNCIVKKYDILKYSEGISVSLLEAIYRAYYQDLSAHVCRVNAHRYSGRPAPENLKIPA